MSNPNVFRGVMDAGFAEAIADQHVQRDIIKAFALPIERLRRRRSVPRGVELDENEEGQNEEDGDVVRV